MNFKEKNLKNLKEEKKLRIQEKVSKKQMKNF
jgi:hypothetical protein